MSLRIQCKEEQGELEVTSLVSQSPDLNVDCVWDHTKRRMDLSQSTSAEELWLVFRDVWNNMMYSFSRKRGHTSINIDINDLDFSSVHSLCFFAKNTQLKFTFVKASLCVCELLVI